MTERQTYLDSAAGILLMYMITYHCAQWAGIGEAFVHDTIWLSFFMPWFFFKGGLVHSDASLRETVRKGFKRLIIPWIVYNIIGTVIYFGALAVTGSMPSLGEMAVYTRRVVMAGTTVGNLALWFLLSLFVVRIIFCVCSRHWAGWIAMAVIATVPFVQHYLPIGINIPKYVINIPAGLIFYCAGYLLRRWHPRARVILAIVAIYTASTVLAPTYVFMYDNQLLCGEYLLYPVFSILGCLSINGICRLWLNRPNPAAHIGADTMTVYCLHWPVIVAAAAIIALCTGATFPPKDTSALTGIETVTLLIGANAIMIIIVMFLGSRSKAKVNPSNRIPT